MKHAAEKDRFRQDLYYRLNVFPIEVAPLRRRKEDIPLLAKHLLSLISQKSKRPPPRLIQANLLQLQRYDWPGNVRELQKVTERSLITSQGKVLEFKLSHGTAAVHPTPASAAQQENPEFNKVLPEFEMRQWERNNTTRRLKNVDGKYMEKGARRNCLESSRQPWHQESKRWGFES